MKRKSRRIRFRVDTEKRTLIKFNSKGVVQAYTAFSLPKLISNLPVILPIDIVNIPSNSFSSKSYIHSIKIVIVESGKTTPVPKITRPIIKK